MIQNLTPISTELRVRPFFAPHPVSDYMEVTPPPRDWAKTIIYVNYYMLFICTVPVHHLPQSNTEAALLHGVGKGDFAMDAFVNTWHDLHNEKIAIQKFGHYVLWPADLEYLQIPFISLFCSNIVICVSSVFGNFLPSIYELVSNPNIFMFFVFLRYLEKFLRNNHFSLATRFGEHLGAKISPGGYGSISKCVWPWIFYLRVLDSANKLLHHLFSLS